MKTILIALTTALLTSGSFAQQIEGTEIGFDGYFGASTNGGNFSIGGKYGLKLNENFITGPSVRYQRNWTNAAVTGIGGSFNVFGVGAFAHGRFANVLFAGAEFEMMRTPFSSVGFTAGPTWSPALFLGGGYSQEFNEKFRINAGIMYDVIDHVNSPFRQGYFMRNSQQKLIPLIYRITFFFPIS